MQHTHQKLISWSIRMLPCFSIIETKSLKMKIKHLFLIISFLMSLSLCSCATLVGGAKYNAKIVVSNHPDAKIIVNGQYEGTGETNVILKRRKANKLEITVQKDDCEPETTKFIRRSFRGWALAGDLLGLGLISTIVDISDGSLWKPCVKEKGVRKENYDNFVYTIYYKAIPIIKKTKPIDQENKSPQLNNKQ